MANPSSIFRSCRRFQVVGEVPEDFRDKYLSALNENAFKEALSPLHKEKRSGWCIYQRPLLTDFADLNLWLYNNYAVFSLRIDQKKVPPKLLRARLDEKIREWCSQNNRERAPAAVKTELKEALEAEMLQKTLPSMRTIDILWNVAGNYVVLGNKSDNTADLFRKLFHRTFGLTLEIDTFEPGEEGDRELLDAGPLVSTDLAADWLAWIAWRGGEGKVVKGEDDAEITFFVDSGVKMDGFRASEVNAAVVTALAQEKNIEGLTIGVKRSDREYLMRLDGLLADGFRLPTLVKGGDVAEQVYEAAFLYEEAGALLTALFEDFAKERKRAGKQHRAAMKRWMGSSLDPVREFLERLRAT